MEKKVLIDLSSSSYEHKFDRVALRTLRALPGFDVVTNFFLNWTYLKWHVVELQGSNFLVTRESCPDLYDIIKNVADTLDVRPLPRLYTEWGYDINGYTTGYKEDTLIVLNSGTVDLLSEDELRYVAGHEMGHVKSGHVLYHTMGNLFNQAISKIPLGETLTMPIYYGLKYWERMSEFTADRAGLLANQNIDATIGAIIKMSGLPMKYFDVIEKDSFIKQACEFRESFSGLLDQAIKGLSIIGSSHPWSVYRAAEILMWYESGQYQEVLDSINVILHDVCGHQIPASSTRCPYCGLEIE